MTDRISHVGPSQGSSSSEVQGVSGTPSSQVKGSLKSAALLGSMAQGVDAGGRLLEASSSRSSRARSASSGAASAAGPSTVVGDGSDVDNIQAFINLISKPPSSKSDYNALFQLMQALSYGGSAAQDVLQTLKGTPGLMQALFTGDALNCSFEEVSNETFADDLPDWVKQNFDISALKTWAKTTFGDKDAFAANKKDWAKTASHSLGSFSDSLNLFQIALNRAKDNARGGGFAGLSQESEFNIIERYCNTMTMSLGHAQVFEDGITGFEKIGELLKALTPPAPDPQKKGDPFGKADLHLYLVDNGWSPADWDTAATDIVTLIQSLQKVPGPGEKNQTALNQTLVLNLPHTGDPPDKITLTPLNLLASLGVDPNSPSSQISSACTELVNNIKGWSVYDSASSPPAQTTIGEILASGPLDRHYLATSLKNTCECVDETEVKGVDKDGNSITSYAYSQDPLASRHLTNFTNAITSVASYGNRLTSGLQAAQTAAQSTATQILSLFQALLSVTQQVLNAASSASPKS